MEMLDKVKLLGKAPVWIALAALLVLKILGVGRTLLLLAGGVAGYFIGVKKAGEDDTIPV